MPAMLKPGNPPHTCVEKASSWEKVENPISYSVRSIWYLAWNQMAWDPLCILGIGYSRHQGNTLPTNLHIPKLSGIVKKKYRRAPT